MAARTDIEHKSHAPTSIRCFVLTVSDTRNTKTKQALFARIVGLLAQNPGLRKEDVFINLVECKTENWSIGNGIAQYVTTTS